MLGPYYNTIGLSGNFVPQAVMDDIFTESRKKYGVANVDPFNRRVVWTQTAPGQWTVEVAPPTHLDLDYKN